MRRFAMAVTIAALCSFSLPVFSMTDLYVASDGIGTTCSSVSPCPLQYALTHAQDDVTDDVTIHLAAGTYDGGGSPYTYNGCFYSITLAGQDASNTFIQSGSAAADAMSIGDGGGISISEITFQNSRTGLIKYTNGCGDDHPFEISDCQFISNQQGLNIQHDFIPGSTSIHDNVFDSNTGASNGAGLYLLQYTNNSPVTIANNVFNQNTSTGSGAGVFLIFDPSYDGAASSLVTFSGNTFSQNTSSAGGGGGVFLQFDGVSNSLVFDSNWLDQNAATSGGAGYFNFNQELASSPLFTNNIVTHNDANLNNGGGFYISGFDTHALEFINNTLVGNSAVTEGRAGGGICLDFLGGAAANFYNNIFWDNAGNGQDLFILSESGWDGSNSHFENNDFQQVCVSAQCSSGTDLSGTGFAGTQENMSEDPQFSATGEGALYYELALGSPVIGAGSSEVLSVSELLNVDFDGKPRPTPNSNFVDFGALQYQGPIPALNLSIQVPTGELVEGGEAQWVFVVSNGDWEMENMTLSLQFSDNQEYQSGAQASLSRIRSNSTAASCAGSGNGATCALGDIAANTSVSVSVDVKILSAGTLTVNAVVSNQEGTITASSTGTAIASPSGNISGDGCSLNSFASYPQNVIWIYSLFMMLPLLRLRFTVPSKPS